MKSRSFLPLLVVVTNLTLLLFLLSFACSRTSDQPVLAQVENEKITSDDLKRLFQEEATDYSSELLNSPEGNSAVRRRLLDRLIEETLLLSLARQKKIALTADEFENPAEALRSGYPEGALERTLEDKKIPLDQWLERQRKKRIIEKLIDQEVYAKIHSTNEEIEEIYRKNPQLFLWPEQVLCRHIVASKQEKTKMILSLLKKGESFEAVARNYSESPDRDKGGDLGWFGRGDYPAVFGQSCFGLRVGETSDVVVSEYGYHIFRAVDKRPSRKLSLEEASPAIKKRLKEEKGQLALQSWLQEVHKRAKITVDEKALREVPLSVFKVEEYAPKTKPQGRE